MDLRALARQPQPRPLPFATLDGTEYHYLAEASTNAVACSLTPTCLGKHLAVWGQTGGWVQGNHEARGVGYPDPDVLGGSLANLGLLEEATPGIVGQWRSSTT